MTPNTNSDNEINVWCDWLTDNGYNSDEIRFEEIQSHWILEQVFMRMLDGTSIDVTYLFTQGVGPGGFTNDEVGSSFRATIEVGAWASPGGLIPGTNVGGVSD